MIDWLKNSELRKNEFDIKNKEFNNQVESYTVAISTLEKEIIRLKRIIQAKKPEQEKMIEAQLKTAAISTAMNLGAGIITRLVPNKQVVTHRNERS